MYGLYASGKIISSLVHLNLYILKQIVHDNGYYSQHISTLVKAYGGEILIPL